jgi:Ca2+-binding EF-hand superfamily protein
VGKDENLSSSIEQELTCLLEKEIAYNRVLEELKQYIQCTKQFDYYKAFQEIDDWSYGYIDRKNLKSFLRKHGCKATSKDVNSIIRRMDLDGDARLNKEEFIKALLPEEPYSKLV